MILHYCYCQVQGGRPLSRQLQTQFLVLRAGRELAHEGNCGLAGEQVPRLIKAPHQSPLTKSQQKLMVLEILKLFGIVGPETVRITSVPSSETFFVVEITSLHQHDIYFSVLPPSGFTRGRRHWQRCDARQPPAQRQVVRPLCAHNQGRQELAQGS